MLNGHKFLVLPNEDTSRRRYIRTLIDKNGGQHGAEIGLIDDSFIHGDHIIDHRLFYKELNPNDVPLDQLRLFKLSDLTKWLKHKFLDFSKPLKLYEEVVVETDSQESNTGVPDTHQATSPSETHDAADTDVSHPSDAHQIMPMSNPNYKLIKVLKSLEKRYKLQNDTFRYLGYMKMIKILQNVRVKIESEEDAIENGLSKGLSKKIPFLLKLGESGSELKMDTSEQTLLYFQECHGIGAFKSKQYVNMGYSTFEDLIPYMNWTQLTGLAFYEDWQLSIPREETMKHEAIIRKAMNEVNENLCMEITGSYRRGQPRSGDIDIVVHMPGQNDLNYISREWEKVIIKLTETGYIICPLNLNETLKSLFQPWFHKLFSHFNKPFDVKAYDEPVHKFYCGAAVTKYKPDRINDADALTLKGNDKKYKMDIGKTCRRVDFLLSEYQGLGATNVYFTGNNNFNKKCRTVAKQKGYVLSNDGIYKDGQLIPVADEYEILDMIGVDKLKPIERNL
ncbi:Pol4 [Kluyveromyces lactis]|nr:Pol4 [Kluyveromyces lactis]